MARVLAISSQVVRGHVGLSAIVPALHGLRHEVQAFPTILLSNHPGHGKAAGQQIAPELLARMFETIGANGWLTEVGAVITGYLPSEAHVRFACDVIRRLRAAIPDLRVLVDPVLGDEPKGLYIDRAAADMIACELVNLADITTPNVFELGWLTGQRVSTLQDALAAADALTPESVVVTSAPGEAGQVCNILVRRHEPAVAGRVARRAKVPNGTGDMLAALYFGHELNLGQQHAAEALALAAAGVEAVIDASEGCDELQLATSRDVWVAPVPLPLQQI